MALTHLQGLQLTMAKNRAVYNAAPNRDIIFLFALFSCPFTNGLPKSKESSAKRN